MMKLAQFLPKNVGHYNMHHYSRNVPHGRGWGLLAWLPIN